MTTSSIPAGLAAVFLLAAAAGLRAQDRRAALERAVQDVQEAQPPAADAAPPRSPAFRLIDVSLDVLAAAGASTERDDALQELKGGGHDPRKRGFTVQNVELSLTGAVDPYFLAEAHLITFLDPLDGETVVELEEAFLTTQALPAGLQLEVGQFFTEFGRHNPRHPHAWSFLDQPVILTRVFGPDGIRGPGARLSWLLPLPFFAELHGGVQNASGETMASFLASDEFYEERGIGGRSFVEREVRSPRDLVWLGRLQTSFDLSEETSFALGTSVLFGPNASGPGADTLVWGADVVWRWRAEDGRRGRPFVTVEGEVVARRFDAAAQVDAFDRASDPFRADRVRVSPLLSYHPTEFSRMRLQYDFDEGDALDQDVHSVWLGFEVTIGKHAAHTY
jgi:hypothetical protein